jgi:hypothetical protein
MSGPRGTQPAFVAANSSQARGRERESRDSDQAVNDATEGGICASKQSGDQVELGNAYEAPVDGSNDDEQ